MRTQMSDQQNLSHKQPTPDVVKGSICYRFGRTINVVKEEAMTRSLRRSVSLFASIAVLSGAVLVSTGSAQPDKVEAALMQLERDWCNASLKNDVDWLTRVLADDASFVTSTGQRQNKAQVLADFKAETTKTCQVDQMQVRVHGEAAVVTGRWRITGTDVKGKPFANPETMFTDTFVRRNGEWRCVASHSSAITK
jgi:uncharacterized protein (TIGR02246 family)